MKATVTSLILFAALIASAASAERSFVVKGSSFMKDGQPFRIISGAFHYFRTSPDQWRDRLHKMRLGGLNTVETYVAWNLHEPVRGQMSFEGILDLAAFLRAAADEGLLAIVRPPPYICAEWEFGGLPSWLLETHGLRVRCSNAAFLSALDPIVAKVAEIVAPLQYSRGGPVIMVQVENEYGSFGNDKAYLQHIADTIRKNGVDSAVLFSSNGWSDDNLRNGALDTTLRTVNFGVGTDVKAAFSALRRYESGPLFVTEFWDGWFDHWGEKHHTATPEAAGATLDAILALNASVNFYMYTGGTNFGFMNGANWDNSEASLPVVTSYDYDSPISECGDVTRKWSYFRDIIGRYVPVPSDPPPPNPPKAAYGSAAMSIVNKLFDESVLSAISKPVFSSTPLRFSELHQSYGFVLYTTTGNGPINNGRMCINELRDRANVFIDEKYVGSFVTAGHFTCFQFSTAKTLYTVQILVENVGRVNFGSAMETGDKGILGGVNVNDVYLFSWKMWPLPMSVIPAVPTCSGCSAGMDKPAFYRGTFNVAGTPSDTFLDTKGWSKGVAFVNGFNLGRYYNVGPQRTLYVPAAVINSGKNEIFVFELGSPVPSKMDLLNAPILA